MAASNSGIALRGQPGELEVLGQPGGGDLPLEPLAEDAVADQQEADVRVLLDDAPAASDHVLVSFEVKQPGDLADHDVFRPVAQFAPDPLAVLGRRPGTARPPCRCRSW